MNLRNIYIAFDPSVDKSSYQKLIKWENTNQSNLNFINGIDLASRINKDLDEVVKPKIHDRMKDAEIIVLLLGSTTKKMRKFIRWQVEYACENHKPLIAININGIRAVDYARCPVLLKRQFSLHIPFHKDIFAFAIDDWPIQHEKLVEAEKKGTYIYSEDIYNKLNIDTTDCI